MIEDDAAERNSPHELLRVLAISGSLRKASVNTSILKCLARLEHPGIALSVRTLEDLPLYNEDQDTERELASVAMLKEDVRASDGAVIATPEY